MKTEPEAVLFDFDGTLVDTEPAIMDSFRYVFRKYRTEEEFTPEIQVDVLGPTLKSSMEKYFPDQDADAMVEDYETYQLTQAIHSMVMMEGAVELVKWIRSQGMKTGLVSSRLHESMDFILKLMNYHDLFDVIVGIEDLKKGKPDPEGILKAMKDLGVETAVYVGDSGSDILAGKNAGISTIAYCTNEKKRESLLRTNPDYVIEALSDIQTILENL